MAGRLDEMNPLCRPQKGQTLFMQAGENSIGASTAGMSVDVGGGSLTLEDNRTHASVPTHPRIIATSATCSIAQAGLVEE